MARVQVLKSLTINLPKVEPPGWVVAVALGRLFLTDLYICYLCLKKEEEEKKRKKG